MRNTYTDLNQGKKTVYFAEQIAKEYDIPRDGEAKVEANWKDLVRENERKSAKKSTILKDMLEEDLTYFSLDGELDSEPDKERKEQLYWLLDELNLDGALPHSIISDKDTYKSVEGLSKKRVLVGRQETEFTQTEVKDMFDKIANWKKSDLERNGQKEALQNGEDYLKYVRRLAIEKYNQEKSQSISI